MLSRRAAGTMVGAFQGAHGKERVATVRRWNRQQSEAFISGRSNESLNGWPMLLRIVKAAFLIFSAFLKGISFDV